MHSQNHWGGSFEIHADSATDDERSRNMDMDRAALSHQLDETQQSWLLGPEDPNRRKRKYVDLGCVVCSRKALKWTLWSVVIGALVIVLPIVIVKTLPKHRTPTPPPDTYTIALHRSLLFFNAQKSGRLPKNNGVSWRGDSGLTDGSALTDVKGGLVGGYYDAGDNIKFHFPMAFSMTMLSWTVIEYSHKYKSIGEYNHVRDLIKWGTDYLLLTFNSSASTIDHIYCQVGTARNGSTTPDDHYCWQRPEDMSYPRPVESVTSGPDLAGEMAAALAAASIVFQDDTTYSKKLVKGAETLFKFARDGGRRTPYSRGKPDIELFYNSTGYYDEYMWGAAWMYYATGNISYLSLATNPGIPKNSKAFMGIPDLSVLSWDNKLPAAQLLLTRMRIFLNPGYPYEDMLMSYHNVTGLNMCSYLHQFNVFNWTRGGMIQLNHGRPQPLQYVANAAFLASLFADYLNATGVPGWFCGPNYFSSDVLRRFATSQVDYILGANPMKMSYVVGYGAKYPKHVHHRGASIPKDGNKYSCTGGWKWRDAKTANPNTITGAMVGGPDRFDGFSDVRTNYNYTEPTMAGNAGLVAALVSLTGSGGGGVAKNTALYVSTTTKLEEAMRIMKNHKFSSIPVYDKANKQFVGSLDYFAIMAYVAFGEFKKALVHSDLAHITFEKQLVGELVALSKEGNRVWVFEPTDNLETILEPMSKGVHRVTVNKKKGQKRAVITQRDVLEFFHKWIESEKSFGRKWDIFSKHIGELSLGKTPAVTIPAETTAIEAFQKMYKEDVSSLGIVDETGALVANLSVTDLRWLNHDEKLPSIFFPVLLFLHEVHGGDQPRKPVVVDDTATLPSVVARLVETRVKRAWVIDGAGKPTGVISLSDVISKFSAADVTLLK